MVGMNIVVVIIGFLFFAMAGYIMVQSLRLEETGMFMSFSTRVRRSPEVARAIRQLAHGLAITGWILLVVVLFLALRTVIAGRIEFMDILDGLFLLAGIAVFFLTSGQLFRGLHTKVSSAWERIEGR